MHTHQHIVREPVPTKPENSDVECVTHKYTYAYDNFYMKSKENN